MCTRFYVEPAYYAPIITRAQKLKLADDMMRHLSKPLTMSGEMRPTDVVAVLAPNKEGNVLVFSHDMGIQPRGNRCSNRQLPLGDSKSEGNVEGLMVPPSMCNPL